MQREKVLDSNYRFILRCLCKNGGRKREVIRRGHRNKGGFYWDRREILPCFIDHGGKSQ